VTEEFAFYRTILTPVHSLLCTFLSTGGPLAWNSGEAGLQQWRLYNIW